MDDRQADRQMEHGDVPLRRGDQLIVGLVVAIGFCGVAFWWVYHGGWSGEVVRLDRAKPHEVTFTLDVNEAQWPELAQLPGIGETLARRIVDERKRGGRFASAEEIERRVSGIGPKVFQQIKQYLRPVPAEGGPPEASSADANGDSSLRSE